MVNEISNMLMCNIEVNKEERGKKLEGILTDVCTLLGEAGTLTEGKADMEFLLGIVASYVKADESGTLEDDVATPGELFEERVFPQLDNFEEREEKIEDGDTDTTEVVGGVTSE